MCVLLSAYCYGLSIAELYKSTHLPWGTPSLVGLSPDACLLAQDNYVSLYSNQFQLPLWTAYKLTQEVSLYPL